MIARVFSVCAIATLGLVAVPEAAAQPSRFEVSGGYQSTRAADQIFAVGWSADVSGNLSDAWGIVAEISGTRREEADADLASDVTLSIRSFGGGLRLSKRGSRIVPFLQMSAGVARLSAQAEVQGTEIGESVVKFMLQPGGGVNVMLNDRLGLVGQVDYRRVFLDESDGESGENQVRVFLGVRLGL
jgi:hypothetical protein